MMVLQADFYPVYELKRIVKAARAVHRNALMIIHEHGLMIRVMNPDHRVPLSIILSSTHFYTYHFMTDSLDLDECTFKIDMVSFDAMLYAADDCDVAVVHVFSHPACHRFFMLFYSPDVELRSSAELNLSLGRMIFQWTPWWYKFSSNVVQVSIPAQIFEHLLEESMSLKRPIKLSVSPSLVTLYVGSMPYPLQDEGVEIMNVPDGATVDIKLRLYRADYFMPVVEISHRVIFRTAYPSMIRGPWPIMIGEVDGYPGFHFNIPPYSIVVPRVQ